jgi:hypothetical protein
MSRMLDFLRRRSPAIILAEDESDPAIAYLYPMCLKEDDPGEIIDAFDRFAKARFAR